MRLCRFNDDCLGYITREHVSDVSLALDLLPALRWPLPPGDPVIAHLAEIGPKAKELVASSFVQNLTSVRLKSPVANPSKIIGAPVNYRAHHDEARADAEIHHGRQIRTIDEYGLFLKSNTSLAGSGEGVEIRFPDRRTDHELELAVVIGREARDIAEDDALEMVAGYCIGLDMTIRGTEDRSLRKSLDGFTVLGPCLVTADEVPDPDNLDLSLAVNGEVRQSSNTSMLIFSVRRLIAYASRFYRLYPGDVIMTGTPEGVGPVAPGDMMTCRIQRIGEMEVAVRAA